jgi:hypothetical protein
MPRPLELTFEKLKEYDIRIDNDPFIDPILTQNPIIREICYAGQYLADKLVELNCPDILIARIMYTAGAMCFGRKDPWAIHQDILNKYIDNTLEFEIESNDLN